MKNIAVKQMKKEIRNANTLEIWDVFGYNGFALKFWSSLEAVN